MVDTTALDALLIVSFDSVTQSIRLLRDSSIGCRVFPTPPSYFPGCSVSVAVRYAEVEICRKLLEDNGISVLLIAHCKENPVKAFYEDPWN